MPSLPVSSQTPLVTVMTPVYNGEDHLDECISSVLAQSYRNFEYIIVDNRSTDGSGRIARRHAERDPRIRVVTPETHLPQLPNFNRALHLPSPDSRYLKLLFADDWMFPRCLEEMVSIATRDPDIGVVGSYSMYGDQVSHSALPYSASPVYDGKEATRRYLMGDGWFLGSATCLLLRTDLVRARDPFFEETGSPFADTDAWLDLLQRSKFGFVFQVLTYNRRDNVGHWARIEKFEPLMLHNLLLFRKYGRTLVDEPTYQRHLAKLESGYYWMLSLNAVQRRGPKFWEFHEQGLAWIGERIDRRRLAWGIAKQLGSGLLNPKQTLEQLLASLRDR